MVEKQGFLVDADGVIEFPYRIARHHNFTIEWYSGARVIVRRAQSTIAENAQLRALTRRVAAGLIRQEKTSWQTSRK